MKRYPFIVHLIGWICFLSLPLIFTAGLNRSRSVFSLFATLPFWTFVLVYVVIFYLNYYVLLPKIFVKNKLFLYGVFVVILGGLITVLKPYDRINNQSRNLSSQTRGRENGLPPMDNQPDGPPPLDRNRDGLPPSQDGRPGPLNPQAGGGGPFIDIISTFLFFVVIAFGIAIDTTRRWRQTEQRAILAEADKANAELSFLKAQINPHFLFNTLNNIYSLAVTKSDDAPGSILKLSNIMRYITDEAGQDFVSLESEVRCVSDYIELQRIRLGKKVTLDFQVQGQVATQNIAPLVLMTFIENVFKYGTSNHEPSHIEIALNVKPTKIFFSTRNKIFNRKLEDRTGIGIVNTKKRLAFLYPNRHELLITNVDGIFTVELTLLA